MEKETFRCVLTALSPVHIGCDEVYEPTGFAMDEEENRLVIFDPVRFISDLSHEDKSRFSELCMRGTIGSILDIYKFLRNHPATGRSVALCSGFREHYHQVLNLPQNRVQQELNRFLIERTSFCSSDERPYVPGSAVKGALRTAFLNKMAREGEDLSGMLRNLRSQPGQRGGRGQRPHRVMEERLLDLHNVNPKDRISKDPFRLVKVSDFMPAGEIETRIFYAVNKKKRPTNQEPGALHQILETVVPGSRFIGEISVESPQRPDAVSMVMEMGKLLESATTFFSRERAREEKELKGIGIAPEALEPLQGISLLRIGRHSGAESVTVERYRDIKILLGRNKSIFGNQATTFWLAAETRRTENGAGLKPFGWVTLERLTDELNDQIQRSEKEFKEKQRQAIFKEEARKKEQEALRREEEARALAEARRQEEEAIAEAERKAALDAMTPEQKAIADLENPNIEESRVVEIFSQMDGFPQELKGSLAQALKAYWSANNKWNKKDCSKKQWVKVQKVKGVLGE